MSLEQLITKEELSEVLKTRGITLLEKEGWPESGTHKIVYLAEEKIPGSSDTSLKYVVKIPQPEEIAKSKKRIFEGIQNISANTLDKNALIKQKKLRHPRVPIGEILTFNKKGQPINIILEDYAPGKTISQIVEDPAYQNLPFERKVEFATSLLYDFAKTLSIFESQNITHNDIKPANLKIDYNTENPLQSEGYILDMNMSKDLSSEEKYNGSDFFSSPERINGSQHNKTPQTEVQSDIFSLGQAIRYLIFKKVHVDPNNANLENRYKSLEILCDEKSFERNSKDLATLPRYFRKVISKMISYNPKKRFSSFREVEYAAHNIIKSERQNKKATLLDSIRKTSFATIAGVCLGVLTIGSYIDYSRYTSSIFTGEKIRPFLDASLKGLNESGPMFYTPKPSVGLIDFNQTNLWIYPSVVNHTWGNSLELSVRDKSKPESFGIKTFIIHLNEPEYSCVPTFNNYDHFQNLPFIISSKHGDLSFKLKNKSDSDRLYFNDLEIHGLPDISSTLLLEQNYDSYLLNSNSFSYSVSVYAPIVTPHGTVSVKPNCSFLDYTFAPSTNLPMPRQETYLEFLKSSFFRKSLLDKLSQEGKTPVYGVSLEKLTSLPENYFIEWSIYEIDFDKIGSRQVHSSKSTNTQISINYPFKTDPSYHLFVNLLRGTNVIDHTWNAFTLEKNK
jgi:serine/threonine protein kinase